MTKKHKKIEAMSRGSVVNQQKSQILFWIFFPIFLGFSFLSEWGGPLAVDALYKRGKILFLNACTGAQGILPVEFYTGQFDDKFFGPISAICAALAFLYLGLKFLNRLAGAKLFFYFFAYFLITKWEALVFPPYGDSASGPMMEAVWLLQNNFDFMKLSQQPLFIIGGPKAYLFSFYPGFQALLMKWTPTATAFLVASHLITFLFSAAIMALFFNILCRIWNAKTAFLLCFLFLALPLTQSQIEQLNMEIPTLIFIIVAFYYLSKKDIFKAALFSGVAIFVKIYALFAAATVFAAGLFLFFCDDERRGRLSVLFSAILAITFAILGAWLLCFVINPGNAVDKVGPFQGWPLMARFPVTYFFLISVAVYGVFAIRCIVAQGRDYWQQCLSFIKANFLVATMFVASAAWFVLFINSLWIPPRYTLILFPSLMIVVASTAMYFIRKEKIMQRILIGLIVVASLSSYGAMYKPLAIEDYSVTERSLEYRNDVKLHMRLGKILSSRYSDLTIATPFNFAQMFAFPEIGFVDKKLDVMIYLFPCLYGGIKNFDGIENMNMAKVLWVGVNTPFMRPPYLPTGPQDFIIEKIYAGNKSAVLFMGGYSINAVYHQGQAVMKRLEASGLLKTNKKIYH